MGDDSVDEEEAALIAGNKHGLRDNYYSRRSTAMLIIPPHPIPLLQRDYNSSNRI